MHGSSQQILKCPTFFIFGRKGKCRRKWNTIYGRKRNEIVLRHLFSAGKRKSPHNRAVASLEEAEGHQRTNVSPSATGVRGYDPGIFCIFLIQNPAFWCILWLRKWAPPVFFIKIPMHWGKWRLLKEAAEWGPTGRKSRPKAESGVEFLGRGQQAPPARGSGSDVNKTKFLTSRPRPK